MLVDICLFSSILITIMIMHYKINIYERRRKILILLSFLSGLVITDFFRPFFLSTEKQFEYVARIPIK